MHPHTSVPKFSIQRSIGTFDWFHALQYNTGGFEFKRSTMFFLKAIQSYWTIATGLSCNSTLQFQFNQVQLRKTETCLLSSIWILEEYFCQRDLHTYITNEYIHVKTNYEKLNFQFEQFLSHKGCFSNQFNSYSVFQVNCQYQKDLNSIAGL